MNNIKVLIADNNTYKSNSLEKELSKDESFKVIGKVKNGLDAFTCIKNQSPDIVLLDIVMPKMDGLDLTKSVKEDDTIKIKPIFIVVTSIEKLEFVNLAINFGVDYYMLDVECNNIINKIKQLYSIKNNTFVTPKIMNSISLSNDNNTLNLEVIASNILRSIGVPVHVKGYCYIKDSIIMSIKSPETLDLITKRLYPNIAKQHKTTPSRVERAIRHAIEVTFLKGNAEKIEEMFGYHIDKNKGKVTNNEFISLIVDSIRLQYNIGG